MMFERLEELESRVEKLENQIADLKETVASLEAKTQGWQPIEEAAQGVMEKLRHPRDYDKDWNPIPKATRDTSAED